MNPRFCIVFLAALTLFSCRSKPEELPGRVTSMAKLAPPTGSVVAKDGIGYYSNDIFGYALEFSTTIWRATLGANSLLLNNVTDYSSIGIGFGKNAFESKQDGIERLDVMDKRYGNYYLVEFGTITFRRSTVTFNSISYQFTEEMPIVPITKEMQGVMNADAGEGSCANDAELFATEPVPIYINHFPSAGRCYENEEGLKEIKLRRKNMLKVIKTIRYIGPPPAPREVKESAPAKSEN